MKHRPPPRGTGITPDTGFDLVALHGGRCVGIATRFAGADGERENERIAAEWRGRGYDVLTIATAEARPYLESLRTRRPVHAPAAGQAGR